jgi:hypothetical protein
LGEGRKKQKETPQVGDEPTLDESYQPSDAQNEAELVWLAGGISLSVWAAFKFL